MKSYQVFPDYFEPKQIEKKVKLSNHRQSIFYYQQKAAEFAKEAERSERRLVRLTKEALYD
jgi:hypothetical protein